MYVIQRIEDGKFVPSLAGSPEYTPTLADAYVFKFYTTAALNCRKGERVMRIVLEEVYRPE